MKCQLFYYIRKSESDSKTQLIRYFTGDDDDYDNDDDNDDTIIDMHTHVLTMRQSLQLKEDQV